MCIEFTACDKISSFILNGFSVINPCSQVQYIGVAPITQVTHMRNKNNNNQGRSPNVVKVIFHTIKDRIRALWVQILTFI